MDDKRLSLHIDAISDAALGLCQLADFVTRDGHALIAWHIRLIAGHVDELVGMVRAELWTEQPGRSCAGSESVPPGSLAVDS